VSAAQSPDQLQQMQWQAADGTLHHGPVCATVADFSVVACAHCGFKHVLPLPTADELRTVYAHDYYRTEKPLYIQHYLEDRAWWDGVYAERYERLESLLPAGRRRLLDVGSGPGLFLAAGQARGWQVTGIEPSEQASAHSREVLGLDVRSLFLTPETAATLGQFDVVNLGEVLEHLSDPAAMLALARSLLAPGGVLVLVVPNDFNPFQQLLHEHLGVAPWWVAPPHHLNYFDAASLSALVQRAGLQVEHLETTFPIDMFLLMGHHYIGNDALGRQAHAMRKTFEMNLRAGGDAGRALKARLHSAFAGLGLGRELLLFARLGEPAPAAAADADHPPTPTPR